MKFRDAPVVGNESEQVSAIRAVLRSAADTLQPLMDLYNPYIDGVQNMPTDGRFFLVGNHTQSVMVESLLIPYVVRHEIGTRVRPLTNRQMGALTGAPSDLAAAFGAIVGSPETAAELMRHNETILVFPGGGREIPKFKNEQYKLKWNNRFGFARLATEHNYPIIPVALVGGDDFYESLTTRNGRWEQFTGAVTKWLTGESDMAMPLVRGIGPTLIPRPQRMYLRFARPIETTKPERTTTDNWVRIVKDRTQTQLQDTLADLLRIRESDPYRQLNPLAWRSAAAPP